MEYWSPVKYGLNIPHNIYCLRLIDKSPDNHSINFTGGVMKKPDAE
jgi:hypothetical protein